MNNSKVLDVPLGEPYFIGKEHVLLPRLDNR